MAVQPAGTSAGTGSAGSAGVAEGEEEAATWREESGDAGIRDGVRAPLLRDERRQLGRLAIGCAVGLVVEVLELADDGKAAFQHLDIELGRHRLEILRPELQGKAIHHLAPGPETVGPRARPLGKTQHEALMQGHHWCTGLLATLPEPQYALHGLRLVPRREAA